MATSADLESWKALGGTVKEDKKRKRYIAPSGGLLKPSAVSSAVLTSLSEQLTTNSCTSHRRRIHLLGGRKCLLAKLRWASIEIGV
jgi:hypothetical protein